MSGLDDGSVHIGREQARRAAVDELSRSRYEHESLLEHLLRRAGEILRHMFDLVPRDGAGSVVALVIVVVLLVAFVAVLSWSFRRLWGSTRSATPRLFEESGRTAAEHRAEAERLSQEARWAEAIQERVRAIARTLEERAILTPQPARTAEELATAAGQALPAMRDRLADAARLFDAVTYGQDPGSPERYATVSELEADLAVAEPVMSTP